MTTTVYKVGKRADNADFVSAHATGEWTKTYRRDEWQESSSAYFVYLDFDQAVAFAERTGGDSVVWRCEVQGSVTPAPERIILNGEGDWGEYWHLWNRYSRLEGLPRAYGVWQEYTAQNVRHRTPSGTYFCFDITPVAKVYDNR